MSETKWQNMRDKSVLERLGTKPKTANQKKYLQTIQKHQLTFGYGPSGTGKTLLACSYAVQLLQAKKIERIICVRPDVDCGATSGYKPGSEIEKAEPYMKPLLGKLTKLLGAERLAEFRVSGAVEIQTLQTMRGDEFDEGEFVILDEAQNTTVKQMKMFVTRFAAGSRGVVNGDTDQIDLHEDESSGLIHVIDRIKPSHLVGFAVLTEEDILRSELVREVLSQW